MKNEEKKAAVEKPPSRLATSDLASMWHGVVAWERRVVMWSKDFYLHKTVWLEVLILLLVAMTGAYVLYSFLYAEPEAMEVEAEQTLQLDVAGIESMQFWQQERLRENTRGLRVPVAPFSP